MSLKKGDHLMIKHMGKITMEQREDEEFVVLEAPSTHSVARVALAANEVIKSDSFVTVYTVQLKVVQNA